MPAAMSASSSPLPMRKAVVFTGRADSIACRDLVALSSAGSLQGQTLRAEVRGLVGVVLPCWPTMLRWIPVARETTRAEQGGEKAVAAGRSMLARAARERHDVSIVGGGDVYGSCHGYAEAKSVQDMNTADAVVI